MLSCRRDVRQENCLVVGHFGWNGTSDSRQTVGEEGESGHRGLGKRRQRSPTSDLSLNPIDTNVEFAGPQNPLELVIYLHLGKEVFMPQRSED